MLLKTILPSMDMSRSVFFKSAIILLTKRGGVDCCARLEDLDFGEKETRFFLVLSDIPSVSSNTRFGDSCSLFVIDPLSKILMILCNSARAHLILSNKSCCIVSRSCIFFQSQICVVAFFFVAFTFCDFFF